MNRTIIKLNVLILLGFSLLACTAVIEDAKGLDERLAEYGYRPGQNVDQIQSYQITDWTYLDSRHLMFSNGLTEHYLISLQGPCAALRGSEILLFKTRTNSLSKFDELVVPEDGVAKHCSIESMSRLIRAE
tara:strand:+ start:4056 stop:4448 length:393 start_codon:yes stop_codon:yes gene_type:complete